MGSRLRGIKSATLDLYLLRKQREDLQKKLGQLEESKNPSEYLYFETELNEAEEKINTVESEIKVLAEDDKKYEFSINKGAEIFNFTIKYHSKNNDILLMRH